MQSFNWIDIDGIRYSWDGQDNIACTGRFGYQTLLSGDKLQGLELDSEDGEVAGRLNVDFASSSISFTPSEGVPLPQMIVLTGDEWGQQEYSLQSLSENTLHGLLMDGELVSDSMVAVTASESSPLQGHVLSWDDFHFGDDRLLGAQVSDAVVANLGEITFNIDMTNQVLEQISPLHDL